MRDHGLRCLLDVNLQLLDVCPGRFAENFAGSISTNRLNHSSTFDAAGTDQYLCTFVFLESVADCALAEHDDFEATQNSLFYMQKSGRCFIAAFNHVCVV